MIMFLVFLAAIYMLFGRKTTAIVALIAAILYAMAHA